MSRRRKVSQVPFEACIDTLSHDGRGVARVEGKAVFIEGALPGEKVIAKRVNRKKSYDEAVVVEILTPSADRVEPKCQHYGVCGGCSLQHLDPDVQIEAKQQDLLAKFERISKTKPLEVLPPLRSHPWGYRRKARVGAKLVEKKGRVLVGFREKRAPYLAEMTRCEVLHPSVGERLMALSELIGKMSCPDRIPQIEVCIGDEIKGLVFRHLDPLTAQDLMLLAEFGESAGFQIYLQPKGPDTITCLYPENPLPLSYQLPDFDLTLHFLPNDFTQVNTEINRKMIPLALDLLQLSGDETVLDLFCGLGNFSLPLATRCKQVVAVEGEQSLVERARENASRNGIGNVEFHTANLFEENDGAPWLSKVDKMLLDPPRSGAFEVVKAINKYAPSRIVYVSCDPATLARDTEELVHQQGYTLMAAGVMDMFPNTGHVESIAVFEKKKH